MTSRSAPPFRVIDASAVVELLLAGERASAVEQSIVDAELAAPDSISPEVLQAIRGLERSGEVDRDRAEEMLANFLTMPIARVPTVSLMTDAWALRNNFTAYDACYVALARRLGSELITADHRLARAPNPGVPLILI
ncbi:MAG: type II toxin-antitoxin system VapC family toxin [Solirubrobacteraceae bacterium]